jgi:hypothetical protein
MAWNALIRNLCSTCGDGQSDRGERNGPRGAKEPRKTLWAQHILGECEETYCHSPNEKPGDEFGHLQSIYVVKPLRASSIRLSAASAPLHPSKRYFLPSRL